MHCTLEKIMDYLKKDLLQTKQELHYWKRRGVIFLLEDISSLEIAEPIEIYHCLLPGKKKSPNAFPIRPFWLKDLDHFKNPLDYYREIFHRYYETNQHFEDKFYLSFKNLYKGTEWFWFYHKGTY